MKRTLKAVTISIILILGIVLLTGCGTKTASKGIIGTWTKGKGEYTYNNDGTAVMNGREGKYSITDNTLSLNYDNVSKTYKFKVEIDGDTMKLTSENGDVSEYTRK